MERKPDAVVEAAFVALERKVRMRDCPHVRVVDVTTVGIGTEEMCEDCGVILPQRPGPQRFDTTDVNGPGMVRTYTIA